MQGFPSATIKHVFREANFYADVLAKEAQRHKYITPDVIYVQIRNVFVGARTPGP